MEKGGHVYILGSETGTLYIGVTSGLYTRIIQHRNGSLSGFAHKYNCKRLLYVEPFQTIDEAIAREKQLKGWRREKKLNLIRRYNPEFKDMAKYWGWTLVGPTETCTRPTQAPQPRHPERRPSASSSAGVEGPRRRPLTSTSRTFLPRMPLPSSRTLKNSSS